MSTECRISTAPGEQRPRARNSALSTGRVAFLAAVAMLTGCNGTTSYLDATGTAGREEAVLGQWLTAVATAVVVIMSIAVLAAIARHRGERNDPRLENTAPPADANAQRRQIHAGLSWIYIGIG